MPKKFLVIGGAGFIGSHLVDELLARGHSVVVLDNFVSGKEENLPSAHGSIAVIRGDVRSIGRHASDIGKVDAVLHLAALISGYDSLLQPDEYVDVNIRGLLRVIEFAAETGVPRIVFASSSTVYGNRQDVPLSEATLPQPLTVYAASKLAGEQLLGIYGVLRGFSHCSLRMFNVYGPRQAPDHPYANVTCKFAHAAANRLPIDLYGDGEQCRDFIYVADVVRAFMSVLDHSNATIYNVGTGEASRISDLIEKLGDITGEKLSVTQHEAWPNDIRSIRADSRRLESEFGVRPETSLTEGLIRTVEFFRHREAVE